MKVKFQDTSTLLYSNLSLKVCPISNEIKLKKEAELSWLLLFIKDVDKNVDYTD